jgi:hypothetical protein
MHDLLQPNNIYLAEKRLVVSSTLLNYHFVLVPGMGRNESIFIIGGIAAGVVVAGSLFLLYPDLMFKNTSFQAQQSGAPLFTGALPTITPPVTNPQSTTTAGAGGNSTNSTAGNTTAGASGSTSTPPAMGPPSY